MKHHKDGKLNLKCKLNSNPLMLNGFIDLMPISVYLIINEYTNYSSPKYLLVKVVFNF